jgi:NAD(P)-dependent dehydrogenase (short-subunit alcohol dehydrogenase family)
VKELIKEGGGTAELVQADVTDAGQVERMVAQAEKALGPIDVLVANVAEVVGTGGVSHPAW